MLSSLISSYENTISEYIYLSEDEEYSLYFSHDWLVYYPKKIVYEYERTESSEKTTSDSTESSKSGGITVEHMSIEFNEETVESSTTDSIPQTIETSADREKEITSPSK